MKIILLLITAAILFASPAAAEPKITYEGCLAQVQSGGYGSGITASKCNAKYNLPSPFIWKCAKMDEFPEDDKLEASCMTYLNVLKQLRLQRLIKIGFYREV